MEKVFTVNVEDIIQYRVNVIGIDGEFVRNEYEGGKF